jgi:hypothetical protein
MHLETTNRCAHRLDKTLYIANDTAKYLADMHCPVMPAISNEGKR